MSEMTIAPVADDSTPVAETPAPAAPAPVQVPADDKGVKIVDAAARAISLFETASKLPRDQRDAIDARAFTQLARHAANNWTGEDELTVTEVVEELPAYGMSGVGSLRYTKQRAMLLLTLAAENGLDGELAYTSYAYPNPQTKRRRHYVRLFGAKVDVARTLAAFRVLQSRMLADAYNRALLPIAEDMPPAQQTRARRAFTIEWINAIHELMEGQYAPVVKGAADARISDRKTAAGEARAAFALTRSEDESTDTTAE